MATVYSSYSAGWKPVNANVYRKYRARLDYIVSEETYTTITYQAVLYVNINSSVTASYSGTLNLDGETYSGSCETTYSSSNPVNTVTCVSAKTKTFTKSETETTATIEGGVKSSNGSWTGETLIATATVTIPSISYTVTFDANGGENPPAEQKKIHGVDLTLSDETPTKSNYDFVEWNTELDGSGTSYTSGGIFSIDEVTTLYAQWHISYQPPQISNLRAYRVSDTASGSNPDVKSNGTRCYADFRYIPSVDPDAVTNSIKIQFGSSTAVDASIIDTLRYGYSDTNHLSVTSKETVTITITVTDYKGISYTYDEATYVSTELYIFDGFKGTSGTEEYLSFAVGMVARDFSNSVRHPKGNFDCYMHPTFYTMAGEIKMWAGNTIPDGWLLCDGSEVSKAEYPNLYAAIGDLWGVPNSSSNFKLPNLSGRVPVGYADADTDFNTVGKQDGEKTHLLTVDEMPSHTHTSYYTAATGRAASGTARYTPAAPNTGLEHVVYSCETSSIGGGQEHNNLQPYAVVKYIICAI